MVGYPEKREKARGLFPAPKHLLRMVRMGYGLEGDIVSRIYTQLGLRIQCRLPTHVPILVQS